jgi:3' terminal RNA ribose 2'-O-methyltransferase Hen1
MCVKPSPFSSGEIAWFSRTEYTLVSLHEERLGTVVWHLKDCAARSVLDLGCGTGDLLMRLVGVPQFEKIVGIDISMVVLSQAKQALGAHIDTGRIILQPASFAVLNDDYTGFDAATLIETIEHINPNELSKVERAVFGHFRPRTVVVTTPNEEYNPLYNIPKGTFRHPDHRFEWTRKKFSKWSTGVAARNNYSVRLEGIGEFDYELGHPTQMAIFTEMDRLR